MRRAVASLAALVIAATALTGCLGGESPDGPAPAVVGPGALVAAPPVKLDALGPFHAEPHVAVREGEAGVTAVVASIVFQKPGATGPMEFQASRWIALHRSTDGGLSWDASLLPADVLSTIEPAGAYDQLADPVLSYAPDGTLYLAALASKSGNAEFQGFPLVAQSSLLTVFVTRSLDDGATWEPAVFSTTGVGIVGFPVFAAGSLADKPWLDVAPDGTVHLVWTEFHNATLTDSRERLWTTLSFDGGQTWEHWTLLSEDNPGEERLGATVLGIGAGTASVGLAAYPNPAFDQSGNMELQPGGRHLAWSLDEAGQPAGPPDEVGPANKFRFAHAFRAADTVCLTGTSDVPPGPGWWACRDGDHWTTRGGFGGANGSDVLAPAGCTDASKRIRIAYYNQGPQGEGVHVVDIADGIVNATVVANDVPVHPGDFRREYLGHACMGDASWVAYVAGNGEDYESTWIELTRITRDTP